MDLPLSLNDKVRSAWQSQPNMSVTHGFLVVTRPRKPHPSQEGRIQTPGRNKRSLQSSSLACRLLTGSTLMKIKRKNVFRSA